MSATTYTIPMSNSLVNGLGGSSGFGTTSLTRNDDGYQAVDVSSYFPNGLNFNGQRFTSLYVNNNGNITFERGWSTYTPAFRLWYRVVHPDRSTVARYRYPRRRDHRHPPAAIPPAPTWSGTMATLPQVSSPLPGMMSATTLIIPIN